MTFSQLTLYAAITAITLGLLFLVTYGLVAIATVLFKLVGIRLPSKMRVGTGAVKLLKFYHIFCVCSWIGAAVSLVILSLVTARAVTKPCALDVLALALLHLDRWIIIPMALNALTSGLLLAFFSGFTFRYPWVVAKGAGSVWALAVGWFLITPHIKHLSEVKTHLRMTVGGDPLTVLFPTSYYVIGGVQFSLLLSMLALSVFKPWHKTKLVED